MDPFKVHKKRADFPLQAQCSKTEKASCMHKDVIVLDADVRAACFSKPSFASMLPSPEHPTDHVVQQAVLSCTAKGPLAVVTANMCKMGAPFEFEPNSQSPPVQQAREAVELYRRTRTLAALFEAVDKYDPGFGQLFAEWCYTCLGATKDSIVYTIRHKLELDHDKLLCTSASRINHVRLASLNM